VHVIEGAELGSWDVSTHPDRAITNKALCRISWTPAGSSPHKNNTSHRSGPGAKGIEEAFEVGHNQGIAIRRMEMKDVPFLVALHSEVFEGYNATMMGRGYLESLYRTLASHAACVSVVAHKDGEILGWIGGVGNWLAFERVLVRQSFAKAPAIFIAILRNRPGLFGKAFSVVWRQFLESVRGYRRANTRSNRPNASRPAALLVIGVALQQQNKGLGQLMMEDFHERLTSKGFTASSANTFAQNESGNRAFRKAGYRLSWAHDGVNHYIKDLTEEAVV